MSTKKYLLMAPGPVQIPESILHELSRPMIHHRTPEFEGILSEVQKKLKKVFLTEQPCLVLNTTGSGGMEAALINVVSPGEKILVIVSGKFGERWSEMGKTFGMNVHEIKVPWGQAVQPQQVGEWLAKNPDTKAVFTQACETSTAVLHPIQDLAKVIHKNSQALVVVDAITSLAVTETKMDEWGLDVVVAGSQKAFMLPTGIAMMALSQRAWEANSKCSTPRYYLDLKKERDANKKNQTYFSSPVAHYRGLNKALDLILGEGLQNHIDRFKKLSHVIRVCGEQMGLKVYAESPSPSVTALVLPPQVDGEKLQLHLEKNYNLTVAGGQDQLKGKILRIGTLGAVKEDDVLETLERIACGLNDFEVSVDRQNVLAHAKALLG